MLKYLLDTVYSSELISNGIYLITWKLVYGICVS